MLSNIPRKIFSWAGSLQINESLLLSAVASVLGVIIGALIWIFETLIELVHRVSFEGIAHSLQPIAAWTVFLLPVFGGLVVGLILHFYVGEERHHGVAGIMEAVALAGGRLRYRRMPAKTIGAAISIGSGASVGPEDPSVQIGANLGSAFGQWMRLSDERMRALVAAGAAAGIAAAFNAPIAGVFFSLEIILGEIAGSALGIVVVAAVSSAVFTHAVSGPQPAFRVPPYALNSPLELPLYLGLGLLAGLIAAWYVRALYLAQDFFHAWRAPRWIKPAAAGLAVGVAGIFLPQIFGVGYDTIEMTLTGAPLAVSLLLVLLAAKLIFTAISIGGGFMGGVFAPSLFLGAVLGAAYGSVADAIFPSLAIAPPAFSMVGMAAVLAGAVHAPLTAILLLFEMTNDYRIILPLMFSVVVSLLVSQHLRRDSVYTLSLARKGIRLERGRDVEILQSITVGEVMQTDLLTLSETDSLAVASDLFTRTHRHGVPVVNGNDEMTGILTVQDIDRAINDGLTGAIVGDVCTRDLLVVHPQDPIGEALRLMSPRDLGRLPVVSPRNPRQLVGILRRSDIVRAYDIALTRRAALRHRAQQVRLGAMSEESVSIKEIPIEAQAPCAGKRISEVPWPRDCVIATVRRGRRMLIPHGDTILQDGDVLVAVAESGGWENLQRLCQCEL